MNQSTAERRTRGSHAMLNANRTTGTRRDGGQIIVIMVGGIIAMFAMVGLIVDGGNAFANQRATQNGTDAGALAGATVLAQNLSENGWAGVRSDGDVAVAVGSAVAANGLQGWTGYYTDVTGDMVDSSGNSVGQTFRAAQVGSGAIPPCLDTTRCAGGHASGVRVLGNKTIGTFVARLLGLSTIGIAADATARSGYVTETCSGEAGCGVLPITFPNTQVSCDDQGDAVQTPIKYEIGVRYIIPLCKNGPGNVGWLDWTPTAGGTPELVDSFLSPNNPAVGLPSWQYMTSTGNVNAQDLENAIKTYIGRTALMLTFDSTCDVQPADPSLGSCPPDHVGGTGSNQWYHVPALSALKLEGVYITGTNHICDTGNGATSCIIGTFEHFVTQGVVAAGGTTVTGAVGIQLIR
jgi:Flp pilus assembly protein TadG